MKISSNKTRPFRPYKDDGLRIKRRRKKKRWWRRKWNYGFQGPPPIDDRILTEEELANIIKNL